MQEIKQAQITLARWFLRTGLAFVYGYAAIEMQLSPINFLKYIPHPVSNLIPIHIFLILFGIFELILVLWFISGKHDFYAGIISFFLMMSIIFPNLPFITVLFRNVAIALASLALAALDYRM